MIAELQVALKASQHPLRDCALQPLPDKGLAHDHVRLVGSGWLARIPKQSQLKLGAVANLAYQGSCFERAHASGHTPQLLGLLPPSPELPRGGLLVQEIVGRAAKLPQDMGAIAVALASLHKLPVPAKPQRAPLLDEADPLRALLDEITAQSEFLEAAKVVPAVKAALADGLSQLHSQCAELARPSRHLIAFDGHPGNFVVRSDGRAVLVDLEKCRYSYPSLDLAHATLYTSTTWDISTHAVLSLDEVSHAYQVWAQAMGKDGNAAQAWHLPLRRAMWLWSLSWCAKWRVLSNQGSANSSDGEDWSAKRSEDALVRHVRNRVDHYLSKSVVESVLQELEDLDRVLG